VRQSVNQKPRLGCEIPGTRKDAFDLRQGSRFDVPLKSAKVKSNAMAYSYPLSIQLTLPDAYQRERSFLEVLEALESYGFSGVELNIVQPQRVDPEELKKLLDRFGLRLTMFASGAAAKAEGLSLSSPEERVVKKSVARCREFIRFAECFAAGVIIGFLKGTAVADLERLRSRFGNSLEEIAAPAREARVPILIEATNRYESAVANTLDDTYSLIAPFSGNPYVRMLPDTFHMNIEEKDQFGALKKYSSLFDSLHLSDNNRFFPGLGAIRFGELFRFLASIDYRGSIAIEGVISKDLLSDLRVSMAYLQPMIRADR
jgi:D-psicose/D-tagatose/L-ribulose 3-epimerase